MKVKRKIRSLLVSLLCVMLLAGVLPTAALAEDQIPTDTPHKSTGLLHICCRDVQQSGVAHGILGLYSHAATKQQ